MRSWAKPGGGEQGFVLALLYVSVEAIDELRSGCCGVAQYRTWLAQGAHAGRVGTGVFLERKGPGGEVQPNGQPGCGADVDHGHDGGIDSSMTDAVRGCSAKRGVQTKKYREARRRSRGYGGLVPPPADAPFRFAGSHGWRPVDPLGNRRPARRGAARVTAPSVVVGLVGAGIGSSMSPALHEREAALLGFDYTYRLFDLDVLRRPASDVGDIVREACRDGLRGLNITHPCKQSVVGELDELSPEATALGAVNTVVLRSGRLVGHNTDHTGFKEAFTRRLSGAPLDRVLLLGAGGAGAAVAHAILELGAGRLIVLDADRARAEALSEALERRFDAGSAVPGDLAELETLLDGASGVTPCHAYGHGRASRQRHPGGAARPTALGRGDRLHASRDHAAAGGARARLSDHGRHRDGRAPGRRVARAVHRRAPRPRADDRARRHAGALPRRRVGPSRHARGQYAHRRAGRAGGSSVHAHHELALRVGGAQRLQRLGRPARS